MNPDGRQSERSEVLTLFDDRTQLGGLRARVSPGGPPTGCRPFGAVDVNRDGRADLLVLTSSMGSMSPFSPMAFSGGRMGAFAAAWG